MLKNPAVSNARTDGGLRLVRARALPASCERSERTFAGTRRQAGREVRKGAVEAPSE